MLKIKDRMLNILVYLACFSYIIVAFILYITILDNITTPDEENIKQCTNLKKFYKDDIFFDNFYVVCDEPINLEISPDLYTRLVEGENYKITYNKSGALYSIEKVKNK